MAFRFLSRLRTAAAAAFAALTLLGGCASNGDPRDPLEPLNRGIYKFNDGVDRAIIKPVAEFYRDVVPEVARTGVTNFFSNLNDILVALNNLLQGKMPDAINDMGRVLVNTTLGVLGFMDPATKLGVDKNNEDFGQTLGRWGLGDGPYLVLPFLGPSSVRDTAGWAADTYTWPVTYLEPDAHRNILVGVRVISTRADLLEASKILETAALDPYQFVRDAYLQRRRNLVYDGNPPDEFDEGDDKAKSSSRVPEASPYPGESHDGEVPVAARATPGLPAAPATGSAPAAQSAKDATGQSRVVRVWLTNGH